MINRSSIDNIYIYIYIYSIYKYCIYIYMYYIYILYIYVYIIRNILRLYTYIPLDSLGCHGFLPYSMVSSHQAMSRIWETSFASSWRRREKKPADLGSFCAFWGPQGPEIWTLEWIGLRENLQESPIFNGKIDGFL